MTIENIIISSLSVILSGILSIVVYLLKRELESVRDLAQKAFEKASAIEVNYLKRFDDLHQSLATAEKNIIASVHQVEINLAKNYMSKDDCEKYHEKMGL